MGKFQKYVPGRIDREAQEKKKLSDTEMLIYKPHTEGLESLTKEELEEYLNLDTEELKKTKMNMKTIAVAEETKKFLIEHKEEISKKMQSNDLERSKRSEKEEDRDAR